MEPAGLEGLLLKWRRWYRRNWKGYQGKKVPFRCKVLLLHDWSPNLLTNRTCRICRNCVMRYEP